MTDPASLIYAAAFAHRRATLAERDAAVAIDDGTRDALTHAAAVARGEADAAMQALPGELDHATRALLGLYRRDALVLREDGIGWRDAVYRAAQAQRSGEADAMADLLVQAPHRTDDERELFASLIANALLPPIAKGRPHGALTKVVDALAAAQDYFDLVGTDPGKSKQKPTTGIKGVEAAKMIGSPLGVSVRTVQDWVTAYQRSVQVLNAAGHDGVAVMRGHIRSNR